MIVFHLFISARKQKKKGQATAKQRLGRILKLHKGGRLIV